MGIMNEPQLRRPGISTTAFWDVDFAKIDFEKNDLFVMEKIANYGTWDDFVNIVRFYGVDRFKSTGLNSGLLNRPISKRMSLIFFASFLTLIKKILNATYGDSR
jgi:hypothetical protein